MNHADRERDIIEQCLTSSRMTDSSRTVFRGALKATADGNSSTPLALHVLAAILNWERRFRHAKIIHEVMRMCGADLTALAERVSAEIQRSPVRENSESIVSEVRELATAATKAASEAGSDYVGLEHIVLTITTQDGAAGQILRQFNVTGTGVTENLAAFWKANPSRMRRLFREVL